LSSGVLLGTATAVTVTYATYGLRVGVAGAATATLAIGFWKGGAAQLVGAATGVLLGDLVTARNVGQVVKPSIMSTSPTGVRYTVATVATGSVSN
jgi:hypothetical protein